MSMVILVPLGLIALYALAGLTGWLMKKAIIAGIEGFREIKAVLADKPAQANRPQIDHTKVIDFETRRALKGIQDTFEDIEKASHQQ